MTRTAKIGVVAGAFAVIAAAVALFGFGVPDADTHRSAAVAIVDVCADEDYRPSCYDEEIPKVMDEGFSMEDAFAVTRVVQELDPSYQYCHVLGHELAAKETAKDPERWKDVVARAPLGVCSNGAIHGAFQERFRVESMEGHDLSEIEGELIGICEPRDGWTPTGMGEATCIHALGHLTMYVTGAEIEQSLELCDRLVPDSQNDSKEQLCYDGAFMQIYQPLEPEDEALIAGKEIETKEEAIAFCGGFEGAARGSCVIEGWPLFLDELDNPATAVGYCDRAGTDPFQRDRCLSGIFFRAMAGANLSDTWALEFCPNVESPYQGKCFGESAARLIETDDRNVARALDLCAEASARGFTDGCYDKLLQYSIFVFDLGSERFYELCNGMPNTWKAACLNQVPQKVSVVP